MEPLKKGFLELLHGDRQMLIFIVLQMTIGFLFWLAMFLPYMVSSSLIGGSLSTIKLPGAVFFNLVFLAFILLFAYLTLLQKTKQSKKVFLIQAISATLIFIYALLFHKVALPTASNGFGKILEFLILTLYWFIIFDRKHTMLIISKLAPPKNENVPDELTSDNPVV